MRATFVCEAGSEVNDRLHSERNFHDQQAEDRARTLRPQDYRITDESYLRHESWIAPAFDALGELRGLRVLDLGCGHGMASVVLARRGAHVTACDLSLGYVREAQMRADANGVDTRLLVCDGERLPFGDGAFHRIWGNAILHHLDMRRAAAELHRVLAPDGRAVFCEPWAGNRWLNWARRQLPYPGKDRTVDEHPLDPRDVDRLQELFPRLQVRGCQLLSMVGRVVKHHSLATGLAWCDDALLRHLPHWEKYCRYVIVVLTK